jgi:hypothetical protein
VVVWKKMLMAEEGKKTKTRRKEASGYGIGGFLGGTGVLAYEYS